MDTAIQSSVYVTSPEHAGWLMKKGFKWRKMWSRRWVALHGGEVVYMEKEPTADNISQLSVSKAPLVASTEIVEDDDPENDPNGFSIHVNDGKSAVWYLRAESKRDKKFWVFRLNYALAIVKWLDTFEKVRVLGIGVSGIVYELRHKKTGELCALKEMEIKNKYQMDGAVSEAGMLKDIMEYVSHPNVIHIEKVFQVGSKFYMVFPLCTGGELYEHIVQRGRFTEKDAAVLAHDLVSGLNALHEQNILHLDVKPENILFESKAPDAKIKITDFGLSKLLPKSEEELSLERFSSDLLQAEAQAFMETGALDTKHLKGTIGYMSPELILTGHCSKAADVFAAGVVLFVLLSGRPPFHGASNREIISKTVSGDYSMAGREWAQVSDAAKDLIRRMLCTDPLQRITIPEVLSHPWLSNVETRGTPDHAATDQAAAVAADALNAARVSGNAASQRPHSSSGASDLTGGVSSEGDEPFYSMNSNNNDAVAALNDVVHKMGGSKSPEVNLTGTLRQLSGHVQRMRSEKLAAGVSRLVSLMQLGSGAGSSTLSERCLVLAPEEETKDARVRRDGEDKKAAQSEQDPTSAPCGGAIADGAPTPTPTEAAAVDARGMASSSELFRAVTSSATSDERFLSLMTAEWRVALTRVIERLSEARMRHLRDSGAPEQQVLAAGGRVGFSTEEFSAILQHFQYTSLSSESKPQFAGVLLTRFMDRDGDGFITIDDILTAQMLMSRRNDSFLKLIFRLYAEALWYPGRQINAMNVVRSPPPRSIDAPKPGPSSSPLSNLGRNPAAACISPVGPGAGTKHGVEGGAILGESTLGYRMPADVVDPPREISARHVAVVFERLGFEASKGEEAFNILCTALIRQRAREIAAARESEAFSSPGPTIPEGSSDGNGDTGAAANAQAAVRSPLSSKQQEDNVAMPTPISAAAMALLSPSASTVSGSSGSSDQDAEEPLLPSASEAAVAAAACDPEAGGGIGGRGAGAFRMDFAAFSRAAEIDDVLVQALVRRPRTRLLQTLRRAACAAAASESPRSVAQEIEDELLDAISKAAQRQGQQQQSSIGTAGSALGRMTISAAFDFAQNFLSSTGGASDASGPCAEGGEDGGDDNGGAASRDTVP